MEHVQTDGGGTTGGGHASGGALSLLYHRRLGAVLVSSMTRYQMVEISNQQAFRDSPHMPLTPRIEYAPHQTYTSLSDFKAALTPAQSPGQITFDARGRLLSANHQAIPEGDIHYHLAYQLTDTFLRISAEVTTPSTSAPLHFILPVISRSGETFTQLGPKTVQISKPNGTLSVSINAPHGFEPIPQERTFNLVPGFECIPLIITMHPGQDLQIRLEATSKT
jgi:hypothetical protein